MPSPPRALPLRHRSYGLMCHSRWALFCFGIQPRLKSLGRLCAVPAAHGSFPTLSLRIFPWMLDPVPRRFTVCPHLFLPRCHRPSPSKEWVGFPRFVPRITTSHRSVFRGCRYSLMFRPPSLLSPQIVPTAAPTAAGQPGILRPGLSCFVTSTRTGYANRLTQAIDGTGTFTLSDPQPCRLLTSLHGHYTRFLATTKQSAPARRIGTFGLAIGAACAFSLGIAVQVLTFRTRA